MKVSEQFPSKYLKAADLQGRECRVTIDHCQEEQVGRDASDQQPVLYFVGKEKGLVLNKTNAGNIADHYGDEMTDWTGYDIILFQAMVDYQGRTVPAIRVKVPRINEPAARKTAPRTGRAAAQAPHHDEMNPPPHSMAEALDDEIPF